jgi:hypothetical protein
MKSRLLGRNQTPLSVPLFTAAFVSMSTVAANALAEPSFESLFFASDVHGLINDNLKGLITSYGGSCELFGLVGDHGTTTLTQITNLMPTGTNKILTQGNHDSVSTSGITPTGAVSSLTNNAMYDAYVINIANFKTAATNLEAYLKNSANGKAHFILSHVPLHPAWNQTGHGAPSPLTNTDAVNASKAIYALLKQYGALYSITYLWAHDHEHAVYDKNIKLLAKPGEKISNVTTHPELLSEVVDDNLTFAYVNAGYVKPIADTDWPAPHVPSASIHTISQGHVWVDRYGNLPTNASYSSLAGLWEQASNGSIPYTAYQVGYDDDGQPLYACRVRYQSGSQNTLQIGKIRSGYTACHFTFQGQEKTAPTYEFLRGGWSSFSWLAASNGTVPTGSTPSGIADGGQFQYVCRGTYGSGQQVGKLRSGYTGCKIIANGAEQTVASYEVLRIAL